MIPWVLLDTTTVPGGGAQLKLLQRGAEFSIMAGTIPLMNSRLSGSEKALALLGLERIGGRSKPEVLIGGLGMGFTLRSVLEASPDAVVTVAELVPAVIAWNRGPLSVLYTTPLDQPRVTVHEGDVGRLIGSATGRYDAILLDVDNGPEGLSRDSNDGLYSYAGLRAAFVALRPGGVLGVWSTNTDAQFSKRLAQTGFAVEELKVRSGGTRHVIWMATRRKAGRPSA